MKLESQREEIIWLAGLLEGEGTFVKAHSGKNSIRARLAMTDKDVIETAARVFPPSGPISIRKMEPPYKEAYTISWSGKRAAVLSSTVLPYMHSRRTEKINQLLKLASKIEKRALYCSCGNLRSAPHRSCRFCHASYQLNWIRNKRLNLGVTYS